MTDELVPHFGLRLWIGASVVVLVVSQMYTAMLGFGVRERCTTVAGCATGDCSPCRRLETYGWLHAGLQVGLVMLAVFVARVVQRRVRPLRQPPLVLAVVFVWVFVAIVAAMSYTSLAWAWARSPR